MSRRRCKHFCYVGAVERPVMYVAVTLWLLSNAHYVRRSAWPCEAVLLTTAWRVGPRELTKGPFSVDTLSLSVVSGVGLASVFGCTPPHFVVLLPFLSFCRAYWVCHSLCGHTLGNTALPLSLNVNSTGNGFQTVLCLLCGFFQLST